MENDGLFDRIRAEYLEMPGMTLRLEQVARLCGIERSACQVVLDALVETRFLCVKSDGAYARLSADMSHRTHPPTPGLESFTAVHVRPRAS